jgi:hypothetical protein
MRATKFMNYVSTLSHYVNSIWKPIKSSRKLVLASPPLCLETLTQDRWAKSDKDKAVVFAKHLAEVFQPHEQEADEELLEYLESSAQPVAPIKPITPKELRAEIGLLHSQRACGMDLITSKMLKELPPKGVLLLTYLFSAILRHHYWSHKLKIVEIILIPKPGKDPQEVKSYRPISLLPTIAKLLEKLILRRIDPDFTISDWVPHHQFGFRTAHSTIQQCHRIAHTILKAVNNKEYCKSVFLDSRTRVKGEVSALLAINSGVPQGSVLGPLLYLLFTSDLPHAPNVTIGTFADDTVILTCHKDVLRASSHPQEYLNILHSWLQKWNIKINETKSHFYVTQ